MMEGERPGCINCMFAFEIPMKDDFLLCRKRSPIIVIDRDGMPRTKFPWVRKSDGWCGDHTDGIPAKTVTEELIHG